MAGSLAIALELVLDLVNQENRTHCMLHDNLRSATVYELSFRDPRANLVAVATWLRWVALGMRHTGATASHFHKIGSCRRRWPMSCRFTKGWPSTFHNGPPLSDRFGGRCRVSSPT